MNQIFLNVKETYVSLRNRYTFSRINAGEHHLLDIRVRLHRTKSLFSFC